MTKEKSPSAQAHGSSSVDHIPVASIVEQLCEPIRSDKAVARLNRKQPGLPSREALYHIVEALRAIFFPGYFGTPDLSDESMHFYVGAALDRLQHPLHEQIYRALRLVCDAPAASCDCQTRAHAATETFLRRLPAVRQLLMTDVVAAYEGDPAAKSHDEVILAYPGLLAIISYRLAHELYALEIPLIDRMLSEHAHSLTGIDIHPGAKIQESFFIDHGTGVVIGETSEIGKHVRIYQGVTLGAKSFPLDANGQPVKGVLRHPVVEDDVVIYSGATILGRINIGRGSTIGGNVWLTHSVPAGSVVTQSEAQPHISNGKSAL